MSSFAGLCIVIASLLTAVILAEEPADTGKEGQVSAHYVKTIALPEDVEVENMTTSHKDGKLTISIPRKA